MPILTATATAVPEYGFTQPEMKEIVSKSFRLPPSHHEDALDVFDRAEVQQRYSVLPLSRVAERRPLGRTIELYREHAIDLGKRAASAAIERAGLSASDVDLVISVSCTGFMIPSLDSCLVGELGLRGSVRRLPITELGCAGGAAALAFAVDFVRAHPEQNALVVAAELSTLCFQPEDASMANLVSTALFGDGAAAAIVTGRDAPGPRVLATESAIIPSTLGEMGFGLAEDGFHITLSKDVPDRLAENILGPLAALLDRGHVSAAELSYFVLHPGGKKILQRVQDALGLDRADTQPSWDVLREYGNLSSATVLFVLHEWMTRHAPPRGARGLLGAFGPGLSAELLLLQWN